jgi:hypothetical protein
MVEYNRGKRFNHAHPIRYSKLNKLSRFCIALYPIHPPFCTCQVVQWQKSKRRWICESTLYVEWRCAFVLCLLESWNLASGDDVYTNIQNVEIALQVGTLHTHVRERYVSHITRGILSAIFFLLFKLVCHSWNQQQLNVGSQPCSSVKSLSERTTVAVKINWEWFKGSDGAVRREPLLSPG